MHDPRAPHSCRPVFDRSHSAGSLARRPECARLHDAMEWRNDGRKPGLFTPAGQFPILSVPFLCTGEESGTAVWMLGLRSAVVRSFGVLPAAKDTTGLRKEARYGAPECVLSLCSASEYAQCVCRLNAVRWRGMRSSVVRGPLLQCRGADSGCWFVVRTPCKRITRRTRTSVLGLRNRDLTNSATVLLKCSAAR